METAKIIFGYKQRNRKDFYSTRDTILSNKVDTGKIIVSDEVIVDNNSKKFIIGYKNNDIIIPLSIQLLRIDGYIKYFESGAKKMFFLIKKVINYYILYILKFGKELVAL